MEQIKEIKNFVSNSELRIDRGEQMPLLVAELQRQMQTKRDYIANARNVFVAPAGKDIELHLTNKDVSTNLGTEAVFGITNYCHSQIATKLEIPQGYYDRLKADSPILLAENVNHWMAKEKPKLLRTIDGKVRAFMSDRYKIIDNQDILMMAMKEMTDANMHFCRADLSETHMFIKAVNTTTSAEIRKGDIVQAGIVIRNSEIGMSQFQVDPFILRLVCTNGMIKRESGIHQRHLGKTNLEGLYSERTTQLNNLTLLSQMRDMVKLVASGKEFDKLVSMMRESTEINISDPVKTVTNISLYNKFTETEKDEILKNFIVANDNTKYGLINSVTASAKTAGIDRRVELEEKAHYILAMDDNQFQEIAERKLKDNYKVAPKLLNYS